VKKIVVAKIPVEPEKGPNPLVVARIMERFSEWLLEQEEKEKAAPHNSEQERDQKETSCQNYIDTATEE
jgi:hypothetical protein